VIFGSKGTLVCQGNTITLKYIDPKQKLAKIKAYPGNPPLSGGFGNNEVLRWMDETVKVVPQSSGDDTHLIWQALYNSIRKNKPFPVKADEAVEVVRVADSVKRKTEFSVKR
jgi:hypothetical protein